MKNIIPLFGVFALIVLICGFKNEERASGNVCINNDTLPCFLAISDIHLDNDPKKTQHELDNPRICNTSAGLWTSTKNELYRLVKLYHPKFIICLGDLAMHNAGENADALADTVCRFLHDSLGKNIPLIIAPGNNDASNGDYARLTADHHQLFYADSNKLSGYAKNSNLDLGYYAVYPFGKKSKFKIIVLNTTIFRFDTSHKYDNGCCQQQDAIDEMSWLSVQLQQATSDTEHILIAMHIPPGTDGFYGTNLWNLDSVKFQDMFLDTLFHYKDNIVGVLAGHSHMDGIRILIDDHDATNTSKFAGLLFSVGAVTTGYNNNPSIKLIQYNDKNFQVENSETYYMNYWKDSSIHQWQSLYDFRNKFHLNPDDAPLSLAHTPQDLLQTYVQEIYSLKSGRKVTKAGDSATIKKSVYVTRTK